MIIANGSDPAIIGDIMSGGMLGTMFVAEETL
jgi:glutamate 5-kinase